MVTGVQAVGGIVSLGSCWNERGFIQIISPALAFNFSSITMTSTPLFLLQEILLWGLSFLHSCCRISFCSLHRGAELTDGYKNHRLFYKNRKTVMLKITLFSTPLKSWEHRLGRQPGSFQPSLCALSQASLRPGNQGSSTQISYTLVWLRENPPCTQCQTLLSVNHITRVTTR